MPVNSGTSVDFVPLPANMIANQCKCFVNVYLRNNKFLKYEFSGIPAVYVTFFLIARKLPFA